MKYNKYGGIDAHDTQHYLNIWVVNFKELDNTHTLLGYAYFPYMAYKNPHADGVVLNYLTVGNPTINLLRTATHEIGHWLNLKHVWGDGNCTVDDDVYDTPIAAHPNYGKGTFPTTSSCGTPDMFMNFMDYADNTCMFTKGQVERGRKVFDEFRSPMVKKYNPFVLWYFKYKYFIIKYLVYIGMIKVSICCWICVINTLNCSILPFQYTNHINSEESVQDEIENMDEE
jgi:hypothetical protein